MCNCIDCPVASGQVCDFCAPCELGEVCEEHRPANQDIAVPCPDGIPGCCVLHLAGVNDKPSTPGVDEVVDLSPGDDDSDVDYANPILDPATLKRLRNQEERGEV